MEGREVEGVSSQGCQQDEVFAGQETWMEVGEEEDLKNIGEVRINVIHCHTSKGNC